MLKEKVIELLDVLDSEGELHQIVATIQTTLNNEES